MDVCYSGFLYSSSTLISLLLTFQFTPQNNVSLYTKILEWLEQKLERGWAHS